MSLSAVIATHRLGLGPKPGELETYTSGAAQKLRDQLISAGVPAYADADQVLALNRRAQEARQAGDNDMQQEIQRQRRQLYVTDAIARTRFAIETDQPFRERLVHFWSNHFAVSADKQETIPWIGSFEAEAIRPHITGRFGDMLLAATRHPAMLSYLDNNLSIGPNSQAGRRADRGINENLAREVLELHSLGVNGGYSQADVTSLARILTGWTLVAGPIVERMPQVQRDGGFAFVPAMHEPGDHQVLGKVYDQAGQAQGRAVLADLAAHPSTAQHLAFKLARHFLADQPSADDLAFVETAWRESDGDLMQVYDALLALQAKTEDRPVKFRTPNEWLIACLRAMGMTALGIRPAGNDNPLQLALTRLNQPVWRPGSPAGWGDTADRWDSPDALGKRVELANNMAERMAARLPATELLGILFGEQVEPALARAVTNAESNAQALALVLLSPQMLRR